jgi:nitrogen fixation NifU-like protein
MSDLDELYREVILEHYKTPHHRGRLEHPTVATRGHNPLCGDQVEISLTVEGDVVKEVAFGGRGCSISQASASMLTDAVAGKSTAEARQIAEDFKAMMRGSPPTSALEGDLEALQGVRKYPVRIKCALLPWTTLEEGLEAIDHGAAK